MIHAQIFLSTFTWYVLPGRCIRFYGRMSTAKWRNHKTLMAAKHNNVNTRFYAYFFIEKYCWNMPFMLAHVWWNADISIWSSLFTSTCWASVAWLLKMNSNLAWRLYWIRSHTRQMSNNDSHLLFAVYSFCEFINKTTTGTSQHNTKRTNTKTLKKSKKN